MPYFNKYPISKNFTFIEKVSFEDNIFSNGVEEVKVDFLEQDILRLTANYVDQSLPNHSTFKPLLKESQNFLTKKENQCITFTTEHNRFIFNTENFQLQVLDEQNRELIRSRENFLGFSGKGTMFQFYKKVPQPFWGFGEKTGQDLNKEGQAFKMWNVDVIADHPHNFYKDNYDPSYVSIPHFITKVEDTFIAFFLDNPGETYFNTGMDTNILKLINSEIRPKFYFGSYNGECQLYIFTGRTLAEVVKKFAKLTGVAELPPIWALGKHQCKFSYMNRQEIEFVVDNYQKNHIPLDCVWMDIDYMQDFKSFTWKDSEYGSKKDMQSWLEKRGVKLVTMIDPGLKQEEGYFAYEEAKRADLLCKTYGGKEFVGHVWPGDTVFPDYSLTSTRQWWSEKIADYVKEKVDGIWIDMNDPATGSVDSEAMLFQKGNVEHSYFHNQYANLMAKGTRDGLLKARPDLRPFVLTRSAYTGIQNYSAVWTGDNASNWSHLSMSIPQSLNLSLSGVSFNGPDVGGFIDVADEKLITRWYQAGFLFPFFRNHNTKHTFSVMGQEVKEVYQEPYVYSQKAMAVMRKFINLRYKLLPYLYNLFYQHQETGEPILRPLFYHYDKSDYYNLNNQFMVGESILQAPLTTPEDFRKVHLPPGYWYDYLRQVWILGDQEIEVPTNFTETNIYIRDGSILPVFKADKFSSTQNLDWKDIEFQVYSKEVSEIHFSYYQDDGQTFGYKKGFFKLTKGKIRIENQNLVLEITDSGRYLDGVSINSKLFRII